ncbi:MAG: hypothetical protein JXR70_11100 [Spirochaetales bacterium]|nr:hypothetical protein [Spirochaetales bacterium]
MLSYQNADGGFGHGLEPDLLTPESTGICLETALYYFDLIGYIPEKTADKILNWLDKKVSSKGYIIHPPVNMHSYPYQPWWANRDDHRIFSILAFLIKLNIKIPSSLLDKTLGFADQFRSIDMPQLYDYPVFLFSLFCAEFSRKEEYLIKLSENIRKFNQSQAEHFILLSRYWSYFRDFFDASEQEKEVRRFIDSIGEKGLIPNAYPELPWWNPIATLDGLILIKKWGYL